MVLEGVVVRSKTYPRQLQRIRTGGMGVRFLLTEELLADLIPTSAPLAPKAISAPTGFGSTRQSTREPEERVEASSLAQPQSHKDEHKTQPIMLPKVMTRVQRGDLGAQHERVAVPISRAYVTESGRFPRPSLDELGTELPPEIPLRFETTAAFQLAYECDLRFGLLFVPTEEQLSVNSAVELLIEVCDVGRRLRIPARVVHVPAIDVADGEEEGGLGVQICPAGAVGRIATLARELGEGVKQ